MENSKIISIEGLKKHFITPGGKFTALNGIDPDHSVKLSLQV